VLYSKCQCQCSIIECFYRVQRLRVAFNNFFFRITLGVNVNSCCKCQCRSSVIFCPNGTRNWSLAALSKNYTSVLEKRLSFLWQCTHSILLKMQGIYFTVKKNVKKICLSEGWGRRYSRKIYLCIIDKNFLKSTLITPTTHAKLRVMECPQMIHNFFSQLLIQKGVED
jgi:hypothetical protein